MMAGNFFDRFDEAPPDAGVPMPPPRPPELGGRGVTAQADANFFDQFDEPAKAEPSMVEALYRGARQGASFNFADELEGVGAASGLPEWTRVIPGARYLTGGARLAAEAIAPGTFGQSATEAYGAAVEKDRAANKAAEEAHPVTSIVGNLGGAVVTAPISPMLTPLRVAQGAGVAARVGAAAGNLAATGAAYGGVSGLGAGEGDLIDRLPEAGTGALVGAVATPAIAGAARGVVAGGRFVGDHVRASRDPAAQADRVVQRAFERDGANLSALADDLERAQTAVQPVIPADIAGPNTTAVAGDIARQPGPGRAAARDFLEARQIGNEATPSQGERITAQLGNILGDDGAVATADSIIASRATKSKPVYEAAFKKQIDYNTPAGRSLDDMLEQIPNTARARANELLRLEDKAGEQLVFGHAPDRNGMYPLRAIPNTRQWDYIRRALWDDALGSKGYGKEGEISQYGSAVRQLIGRIDDQLNTAVPALKAARSIYKGDSDLLDALRTGQTIFRPGMSTEAVRKAVAGLSDGELEMFRLGAANALRGKIDGMPDGSDKARAVYGSPALREKLNAMAGGDTKAHAEFARYLRNESAMFSTRNKALGGSPTAERLSDVEDTNEILVGAGKAVVQAGTGHIAGALKTAFGMMQKVDPSKRGAVMSEARKVLYNPDPAALRSFIARVEATPMKRGDKDQLLSTVATALPRSVVGQVTAQ